MILHKLKYIKKPYSQIKQYHLKNFSQNQQFSMDFDALYSLIYKLATVSLRHRGALRQDRKTTALFPKERLVLCSLRVLQQ